MPRGGSVKGETGWVGGSRTAVGEEGLFKTEISEVLNLGNTSEYLLLEWNLLEYLI
jgi:hypothetical protein